MESPEERRRRYKQEQADRRRREAAVEAWRVFSFELGSEPSWFAGDGDAKHGNGATLGTVYDCEGDVLCRCPNPRAAEAIAAILNWAVHELDPHL